MQSALRNLGGITDPTVAGNPGVQRAKDDLQRALAQLGPLKTNLANYTTDLGANATASKELARGVARLSSALAQLAARQRQARRRASRRPPPGAARLAAGVDQLSAGHVHAERRARDAAERPERQRRREARSRRELGRATDGTQPDRPRAEDDARQRRAGALDERRRARRELQRNGTDIDQRRGLRATSCSRRSRARKPQTQTNVAFATNATSGGNTARVIVVPQARAVRASRARRCARSCSARPTARRARCARPPSIGGPAVVLDDFDRATSDRFLLLVLVLSLVTFLVLLAAFRSPALALLAVALNLVTVGAAVGVLVLCFQGDSPLLGGAGELDAIALMGIFAIVFGLSIDYEVFFMSRLVEGRALTGTTDGAIRLRPAEDRRDHHRRRVHHGRGLPRVRRLAGR